MYRTNPFFLSYAECALWASTDSKDEPLDKNFGVEDITSWKTEEMLEDCQAFFEKIPNEYWKHGTKESAGHDFWLTRNGHGVGFCDRGLPETLGETLTEISESFGESDLSEWDID